MLPLRNFNLLHRSFLKRFPLFIWLLFAVSSVSNFRPDTGGRGGLLFRFASSVQSCYGAATGRAGLCRQISLCVGSTHRGPATLDLPRTEVSVLSPSVLLRLPAALYVAGPELSAVPVFRSSTEARVWLCLRVVSSPASAVQAAKGLRVLSWARCTFSLHGERPGQPEVCAASPRVRRAFSLPGLRGPGSQRLGRPLPGCSVPFPSAASSLGSQKFGALSPGAVRLFPPR